MRTRAITAIVAFIILLPVLYFSGTFVLPVAMAILAMVGSGEMLHCVGTLKRYTFSVPSIIVAASLPLIMYFADTWIYTRLDTAMLLIAIYILIAFAVTVIEHKHIKIEDMALSMIMVLYIGFGFSSIVLIRDTRGGFADGKYLYMLVFIGAWLTDIFAYFCGRAFGKHKLIPEVSPKKTVEGSIGGIVFCILGTMLYGFVYSLIFKSEVDYILLAVCGAVSSVFSQIGDLIMSMVKRKYNIKDYGKVFPGHGGVLDRFDSILAVSIALLVTLSVFQAFTNAYGPIM